jgi:hypothetical protein
MPALNIKRVPTPNATIELTMWPGPTLASDTRAARASERLVRYLNGALAAVRFQKLRPPGGGKGLMLPPDLLLSAPRSTILTGVIDHGPSVPCRSPSSLCGLALPSRASRRSPQHPKCKGKVEKTLADALDPLSLKPIQRLHPFADDRGQRTNLQAMATHHG